MRGNGPRRVAEARPITQHRQGVVITTVHDGNGAAIRDKEVLMPDGAVLGLRGSLVCFPAQSAPGRRRVFGSSVSAMRDSALSTSRTLRRAANVNGGTP
jgi:hypothetical protein